VYSSDREVSHVCVLLAGLLCRCIVILAAYSELNIVLLAWLEVGVVPREADAKDEHHGKEVVQVERPFVRQQVTVLHHVSRETTLNEEMNVPDP
jgi:hypothetical protein